MGFENDIFISYEHIDNQPLVKGNDYFDDTIIDQLPSPTRAITKSTNALIFWKISAADWHTPNRIVF